MRRLTIVEIVILVAICLLLLGLFFPLPSHKISEKAFTSACRANLSMIAEAKRLWAQDQHKATNDTLSWLDLVGTNRYLRTQPECPRGGVYTLGSVGELPRCSIPAHAR